MRMAPGLNLHLNERPPNSRHYDYRSFAPSTNVLGYRSKFFPFFCLDGPAVDYQYCSITVRQGEYCLPYSLGQLGGVSSISEALNLDPD